MQNTFVSCFVVMVPFKSRSAGLLAGLSAMEAQARS